MRDPSRRPADEHVRILVLEEDPSDVELELRTLSGSGIEADVRVASSEREFRSSFDEFDPDVILADCRVSGLSGEDAIAIARERRPDVPVIFVAGVECEERVVELLRRGASDFVWKDRPARLGAAVLHALEETRIRSERGRLEVEVESRRREEHRAQEEARAAQERYRTLVEQIPAVTYLDDAFGTSGRLRYVSPQIEPMLGYTIEEWMDDPDLWEEIVHPDDRGWVNARDARSRELGVPYEAEYRLVARDGHTVWVHDRCAPMTSSDGRRLMHGAMFDITDRKQAEEALRRADEQRRRLLQRLVSVQEEERARVANDIHDDSIQVMTAVGMRLAVLRHELGEHEHAETVSKLEDEVERSIERLRHLLFQLRPASLDREGLAAALRELVDTTLEPGGPVVRLEDRLETEPTPQVRALLFRLAQEALANVRKHARAEHVDIALEPKDGGVLVTIRDDGVGFDVRTPVRTLPGHLGLASMHERAELAGGWFAVRSSPGAGTMVEFWVPDERTGEGVPPGDAYPPD
jgi:PAS domain S-box-containing protein